MRSYNETGSVNDSATVEVAAAPGLNIDKGVSLTDGSGYVPSLTTSVGTTVFYRIHVSNTGNVPLTAVGNTKCNGTNPPKHLNAEFNELLVCDARGRWVKVGIDGLVQ